MFSLLIFRQSPVPIYGARVITVSQENSHTNRVERREIQP